MQMKCAWKELLAVLPVWLRKEVDSRKGESLRNIRLRINAPPELQLGREKQMLEGQVTRQDLDFIINAASRYSPWSAASAARGFLTAGGGHRIGLCGEAVIRNGEITGIGNIRSLCIRVAGEYPGIGVPLANIPGSVLILGAPGWGKTTLLRDLIRQICKAETVCVVDERGELFPAELDPEVRVDVLTGCSKETGISMLLRTMGPDTIAVDEITEPEDVRTLLRAANCGVRLLATAHASSAEDLDRRPIYRELKTAGIFHGLLLLNARKQWHYERMNG
jgi:stage III sporulation protein AA